MSWSRKEVGQLIEEYRKWPNLYAVKSSNYKNRNLRAHALQCIKEAMKNIKPDVSINEIQSKFQALKQNAAKEYKKWQSSMKSGAGADEVSQPCLWYFELISFVFDHIVSRPSTDSLESFSQRTYDSSVLIDDSEMIDQDESGEELFEGVVLPGGIISSDIPSVAPSAACQTSSSAAIQPTSCPSDSPMARKKRKVDDIQLLQTVSGSLKDITNNLLRTSAPVAENKNRVEDHFGSYVVQKLNKIDDEEIRDEAELEILTVLNTALKRCREMKQ